MYFIRLTGALIDGCCHRRCHEGQKNVSGTHSDTRSSTLLRAITSAFIPKVLSTKIIIFGDPDDPVFTAVNAVFLSVDDTPSRFHDTRLHFGYQCSEVHGYVGQKKERRKILMDHGTFLFQLMYNLCRKNCLYVQFIYSLKKLQTNPRVLDEKQRHDYNCDPPRIILVFLNQPTTFFGNLDFLNVLFNNKRNATTMTTRKR